MTPKSTKFHGREPQADKSLLTGESEPVAKHVDDALRSGSLCRSAGGGHQLARDVGAASYAGRLTAQARRASTTPPPCSAGSASSCAWSWSAL